MNNEINFLKEQIRELFENFYIKNENLEDFLGCFLTIYETELYRDNFSTGELLSYCLIVKERISPYLKYNYYINKVVSSLETYCLNKELLKYKKEKVELDDFMLKAFERQIERDYSSASSL